MTPDQQQYIPTNDDEAVFAPTDRPQESIQHGAGAARVKNLPPNFAQTMKALIEASKDPDAPPSLRNMVALLSHLAQG